LKRMIIVTMVLCVIMIVGGCTKREIGRLAYGSQVVCYSGGIEIYNGSSDSDEIVIKETFGDEWIFVSDGRTVRITADCVVSQK